jgi:hypothetical protein
LSCGSWLLFGLLVMEIETAQQAKGIINTKLRVNAV